MQAEVATAEGEVKQQDVDISYIYWVHGALLGLAAMALPLALAIYTAATGGDVEETPVHEWWEVTGPAVALIAIEIAVASWAAPKIAFQMVEERSGVISIKETMRSLLIAQFGVSALLLLLTIEMLFGDPPTVESNSRVAQWFSCQLAISLMSNVVGVIATFFFIVFIQPLGDSMALVFHSANMMYFGEAIAFSIVGVCNLLCAGVLWLLGRHGVSVGVVGVCAAFFAITRMIVILSYFTAWKNPDVSAEVRRERLVWASQHATTGNNHLGLRAQGNKIRDQRRYVNGALDSHGDGGG